MAGIEPSLIAYELDGDDVISTVDGPWEPFAEENGWTDEGPGRVLGTPIWQHIGGRETQTLYRYLFSRARELRTALCVPVRCDSPELRRYLELRVASPDGVRIRVESHLLAAEARPRVALWDAQAPRTDGLLTACSWCKRLQMPDGDWVEVEEGICRLELLVDDRQPQLTHGVCGACRELALTVA